MFRKIVIMASILFVGVSIFAANSISYSGYYVDRIISGTGALFIDKNLLTIHSKTAEEWQKYQIEAKQQQEDGMLPVFPFINFEQSLIDYCVGKNFITEGQGKTSIEKSLKSGGLTVNGYNLLVLHAEILWKLVTNKHITVKEAQDLLDGAKE